MPDPEPTPVVTTPVIPTPAPAPVIPTPAPTMGPSVSTGPVTQPVVPPPELPALTREQIVEIPGKDGVFQTTTLGAMADALVNAPDAKLIEQAELYRKATQENDPAAMRELVNQGLPAEVPPATPEQEQITALRQELDKTNLFIKEKMEPLSNQIEQVQGLNQMKATIEQSKETHPLSAKYPGSPSIVLGRVRHYMALAKQAGHDLTNPNLTQQVVKTSLDETEAFVHQVLTAFQVAASTPAAVPTGPVSVNDQVPGQEQLTPAPIQRLPDGSYGRPGTPAPLSAVPVPVPVGNMVGAQPPTPTGPMNPKAMADQMQVRIMTLGI